MMRICYLAIVASIAAGSAWAQNAPVLAPMGNVTVSYELSGANKGGGASWMKVTYADHDDRVRLDLYAFPGANLPFGSIIWDKPANHVLSLLPDKQSYYQLPATGRANPGLFLSDKMTYAKQGQETIAGIGCTDWSVTNGTDYTGTACVTTDGVVLRASRTKPTAGSMQATKVTYGAPPADAFTVPPDLKLQPNK